MRTLLVANSGTEGTQPRTRPASAPPMRECAQPTLSAQKKRTSTAPPSPAASTGHMPGLLAREGARHFGTPDRPRCGTHVRCGISVPCRLQAGRVRKVRPFRLRLGPLELELGLPAGRSAPRLAPACPSLRGATGRRWPLRHRMCWVTGARLFCTPKWDRPKWDRPKWDRRHRMCWVTECAPLLHTGRKLPPVPKSAEVPLERAQSGRRRPSRIASHCIASHRIASHRIASHRIASHRITCARCCADSAEASRPRPVALRTRACPRSLAGAQDSAAEPAVRSAPLALHVARRPAHSDRWNSAQRCCP